MNRPLLLLLLLWGGSPANAPQDLHLEHASRMEGSRTQGHITLIGDVRFRHGDLHFETQRAFWNRQSDIIRCDSGMVVTRRGARLVAREGVYQKRSGTATAEGEVVVTDSAGEVELRGGKLVYYRDRNQVRVTQKPEFRRFYLDTIPDSVTHSSTPTLATGKRDTLLIQAKILFYNDSSEQAHAQKEVRITREALEIRSDTAVFYQSNNRIALAGSPVVEVEGSEITGGEMEMVLAGEELQELVVVDSADVLYVSAEEDTAPAQQSRLQGDSLLIAFADEAIDSVEVFGNAFADYFQKQKPERKNEMEGSYILLRFQEKKMAWAEVFGDAKSTYFHEEDGVIKGKNRANGDTLQIEFAKGKVDGITIVGKASGTYFGRNVSRETLENQTDE